jgi:hypothetical protein
MVAALAGPLADALGGVRMELRIAQQTEVAAEVEVAAAVQQALIPDGEPRVIGPVELAGSYLPASRCGGDWWSVDELEGGAAPTAWRCGSAAGGRSWAHSSICSTPRCARSAAATTT